MRYHIPEDKKKRLREIEEEKRAINREIAALHREYMAFLAANGWQKYILRVTYSSAYDPWGVSGLRRDGDVREDVYYFAPHVEIPQFEEFVQTYAHDGDYEFWEFVNTLPDDDWYEE